jgi:hypothetical protein
VLGRLRTSVGGTARLDLLILVGLLVLAAAVRFVDLSTRGAWDADQGHDMLVLHGITRGEIPLLGPPTSIGDFHHGVLYYYLLAPAALLSGADPYWVVAEIAAAGVAAVGVTWWLARSIGGSVAGAVAGLLMAVSASAIDESTFIWNPNLIALSSSIALAGAWRAWTTGRARWWLVAAFGVIVTMHCHVLGTILLPPVAALAIADARRRDRVDRRRIVGALVAGLLLLFVSYVPLLIHELQFEGSELRAAAAFLAGGAGSGSALPVRAAIVAMRVLAWPLTGLITTAPLVALLASGCVVAIVAWLAGSRDPSRRFVARWFGLTLLWTIVALTFAAGSLATVIPGLPNDHYHAFADPIVFVVVGLGLAALARWRPERRPVGVAAAVGAVVLLVAYNITIWPPKVAPDGGWPAADAAGARILTSAPGASAEDLLVLHSLPTFKSADAVRFPLVRRGAMAPELFGDPIGFDELAHVVVCDALFRDAIGAECAGPAEDRLVEPYGVTLVDRFEAAPGRWISVYLPAQQ